MLQIQGVSIRKIAEVRAGAAVTGAVGTAAFSKSRDQSSRGTRVWHPHFVIHVEGGTGSGHASKSVHEYPVDYPPRAQENENKETGTSSMAYFTSSLDYSFQRN